MSPQRLGTLARGSHEDLCRVPATVRSAVGQVSGMRDTRVHTVGVQALHVCVYFLGQSRGSLLGTMWGFRRRHPEGVRVVTY